MPLSFNKTFSESEMQSHFYVFETLFISFNEAEVFCDKNNIPYDFIVKTKFYINH